MEFSPITTQEEFDKAIQKRLAQKEREMTESFKEYMSPDDVKALKAECDRKVKEAQDCVKVAEDKLKANEQTVSEITKRAETAELSLKKNQIAYEHTGQKADHRKDETFSPHVGHTSFPIAPAFSVC